LQLFAPFSTLRGKRAELELSMPSGILAADWISHHARYTPTAEAAYDLASGRRFNYAQMSDRVTRVALWLKAEFGIARGDRVGVLSLNDTDVFELQFACHRLGAIFLSLNWRLEASELSYICADASPKVILHGIEFGELVRDLPFTRVALENGRPSEYEAGLAGARGDIDAPELDLDDVWTLMYTSGTSGRPKGAQITYRMCVFNALHCAMMVGLTALSKNLVVLPTYFTGGLNIYANPTFHVGGANIVMRLFDAGQFLDLLGDKKLGLTHLMGSPANFAALAQQLGFSETDFSHLQCVGIGGSAAPRALIEAYGTSGISLRQGWGMTETGPLGLLLSSEMALTKIGSSGLPPLYVKLKICDGEGNEVKRGETGELLIKGPNVMPGYWNLDEANRQSFTSDGWFKSGDAARQDEDGYYYIVDRWDDIFECCGERVYPMEVESVISQLAEVQENAVIGISRENGEAVARAFVVLKREGSLDEAAIRSFCAGRLAPHKVPKEVRFLSVLPRNGAGKVAKQRLSRD
jgi:fatty-acyl-CoA synthase